MGTIVPKGKDKLLDGSGTALGVTAKDPTTRTGMDQGIARNHLDHIFLPGMTMLWIHPLSFAKQPMTKNVKSTAKLADASNAENKVISFAIAPIKSLAFARLALFRFKAIMNLQPLKLPPKPCPSLHKWHVYPRKIAVPLWTKCALSEKIWIFRPPEYYGSCSGSPK